MRERRHGDGRLHAEAGGERRNSQRLQGRDASADSIRNAESDSARSPEQKPVEAQATQTAEQSNPVMGNATSADNTQQSNHYRAIDESKIDWANLKEKWGIDRDELAKSGDLKEMLYNRKSKLVTVTPTFGGEVPD